jgi:hypothetical protein
MKYGEIGHSDPAQRLSRLGFQQHKARFIFKNSDQDFETETILILGIEM